MQITSKAKRRTSHGEIHRSQRAGWLRAAVLGADDAIVSTASLMIGVAASAASKDAILIAGVAGLVAGSMSMAVGEYVSVSSQRDAERADIELEQRELEGQPRAELEELTMIYVQRGLDQQLARRVAEQLSARDRLGAHLRDELGIDPRALARPLQAAWISAVSFASFALVPIVALLSGIVPFISHNAVSPVALLNQTRSDIPSALKSLDAMTSQMGSVRSRAQLATVGPFMSHATV